MTLDPAIIQKAEEWLKAPFDADTQREVATLLDCRNEKEIFDRFYTNLDFGTGGMRGIMAAGLNRMNRYVVARATQGLANYILQQATPNPSVAIAHDSRMNSPEFARCAAAVLAANGIRVFLFDSLRPTPELSFAVRHLGATAGIVVTASHNPKEYNGYKVYWSDGGQVVPPQDTAIIREVNAISDFSAIHYGDYQQACAAGMIRLIGTEVDEAYFAAIRPLSFRPDVCAAYGDTLRIVYTPLHGAGIALIPEALRRWGFRKVYLCESQQKPNGHFPTTLSPNPEEKEALQEAIASAKATNADLVLATDPDCDRVGIAVRSGEEYVLMNGNQVASMLVDYVLSSLSEQDGMPAGAAIVKTIVTTELITAICKHYGVHLDNVLTGFKYIGERIREYEASGEKRFLAGGEESYGYLVGTHARDKDAVVCACLIAEMAADSLSHRETLLDRLDGLFSRYGVYEESLLSIGLKGSEGLAKIKGIMESFRNAPPSQFLGSPVVWVRDYQKDEVRNAQTHAIVGATGLPRSNVLVFETEAHTQIVARPSGTEPKIKFYFSVCGQPLNNTGKGQLDAEKKRIQMQMEHLRAEFQGILAPLIRD